METEAPRTLLRELGLDFASQALVGSGSEVRCERQMGIFVVVTVALYALLPKEEDSLLSVFLLQTSASGQ